MRVLLLLLLVLLPAQAEAEVRVNAQKVTTAPLIDGEGFDAVWAQTTPVLVKDAAANETILLSALYTEEQIFFLVMYPDKVENPFHKPWMWDEAKGEYSEGPHREDTFVFKWSMLAQDVDLSNFSDDDYRADVWYWKANRSNLAGYADDKMHILSADKRQVKSGQEEEDSTPLKNASGEVRYLSRQSDTGEAPYEKVPRPQDKIAQVVNRFSSVQPSGSRADVKAKGRWSSGCWIIEFSRQLQTGHADDIQFSTSQSSLFGVSIFSLYGKPLDSSSPNLYGMGQISEPLRLYFSK